MESTIIDALATLFTLQRWNSLPRVETWVEAENVCYVAHVGYAIGREKGLQPADLEHLLARTLLRSLNKHFLSDIPMRTRTMLKTLRADLWPQLVNDAARKTKRLFPRNAIAFVQQYLGHEPTYGSDRDSRDAIERIAKYAQYKVALEECKTNLKIYDDTPAYNQIKTELENGLDRGCDEIFEAHKGYFHTIKTLKYLRRWNRLNRSVESSVMSHSFLVTFLALLLGSMSKGESGIPPEEERDFVYHVILRAMFHDVTEALTGDIISPVKDVIQSHDDEILKEVEASMVRGLLETAPPSAAVEIRSRHLLDELNDSHTFTIASLVKACDRLALVLECVFEHRAAKVQGEMQGAYQPYIQNLLNSEWSSVRDFCLRLVLGASGYSIASAS